MTRPGEPQNPTTGSPHEEQAGKHPIPMAGGLDALHQRLAYWNRERLAAGRGEGAWWEELARDQSMRAIQCQWVEQERARIAHLAAEAPETVDAFVDWYEALKERGPGQGDPLFEYLAHEASREELRWFLEQEVAGEAGFDDLVALSQVKLPTKAKLELARNYWDEMGRGREEGMHGPMLEHLANAMGAAAKIETTVWESLALGNVLVALATERRYALQSVGALGAVELTAPTRAPLVVKGLQRVGVGKAEYRYFALHAVLDLKHSEAWNREVLRSLVAADPANARPLAEGALLRLEAGARCFARYRRELGLTRERMMPR